MSLTQYKQTLREALQQYKNEGYILTRIQRELFVTKNDLLMLTITNNIADYIVDKIEQTEETVTLQLNHTDGQIVITLTREAPQ